MSRTVPTSPTIKSLADLIEADIRHRGLRSGDSYLSSIEAAKRFSVSTRAANSAMQLLAQRRIVRRKQRLGTVVTLSEHHALPDSPIRIVHLLVHESFLKREGLLADGVVVGIQSVIPKGQMQFNFLPMTDEGQYIERLIHTVLKAQERAGFVLVRASLDVQRAVGNSGLPAVVHGTTYASVENISSLDKDSVHAGRLAVQHMVERGCRNLLVLMGNYLNPGAHLFLDALRETIYEHGLDERSVVYRYLPSDQVAVEREVAVLPRQVFADKCGIVCASLAQAEGAAGAISAMGLPADRRPELLMSSFYLTPNQRRPPYPYIDPQVSPQQIGERIGRLLVEQATGKQTPIHETYPVRIVMPGE